ncbi:hypothetical protein SAMN05421504_110293 [Amycolatopsis xylanica]|uniref:Prenyltransferase and squalene oxidase repeat-containing protein n=1 Tax=Amycolatopsis xylanica TaxID=589385 RepID=A0A1H3R5J0_9PSEU|nr:hypothetical protein [Amycolatopsis xylanica]SDZ21054.1 hypothetical protein SAMN05421504_110293 [Amycolatopsis xylanica]
MDELTRWTGQAPAAVRDLLAAVDAPVAFERTQVLATLTGAGVPLSRPVKLLGKLRHSLDSGEPGQIALALSVLARFGTWASASPLLPLRTGTSVLADARVLEALALHTSGETEQRREAVVHLAESLIERQSPDGAWENSHETTAACAVALARLSRRCYPIRVTAGLRRTVDHLLKTQCADGSWGTGEDTAHAIQILLRCGPVGIDERMLEALCHGCAFLLRPDDCPVAALRAVRVGALHAAAGAPTVRARFRHFVPSRAHDRVDQLVPVE